jgi:hypothetical protein
MKNDKTYSLGYTPSKFHRAKMNEMLQVGEVDEKEIVLPSNWTEIDG